MGSTGTYYVNNPVSGTHYFAPGGYWFRGDGSNMTVQVQAFAGNNGTGGLVTATTLVADCRNVSTGSDIGSFTGNNANTSTSIQASANGQICTAGGWYTGSGVGSIGLTVTSYGGTAYQPTISGISPLQGPAGTVITVNGSDYHDFSTLTFAGVSVAGTLVNDGTITFTIPVMGASQGQVIAGNANGNSPSTLGPQVQTCFGYDGTRLQPWSGFAGYNTSLQGAKFFVYDGSILRRVF